MNEEELKIGMYTEDEIFNYMTEQEGGMLGRSMYDAIFDKIHAQITEIEQLKNENQQLKEQLERSEKARKDVYDYINFLVIIDTQLAGGRFKDTIWGKELLEILDIDKGE